MNILIVPALHRLSALKRYCNMTPLKITPSAIIEIDVYDLSGNLLDRRVTRNALKSSFVDAVSTGRFDQRFTVRLGTDGSPSDYYDVMLKNQVSLAGGNIWPQATDSTVWPIATVTDDVITWSTVQEFDIESQLYIGTVREIGLDFEGSQSDVIHARAVLTTPLILDGSVQLRVRYCLNFTAPFNETTYQVVCTHGEQQTNHTVLQVWSHPTSLWNIIGGLPPTNVCEIFDGDLNAYGASPTLKIGESYLAYAEAISPTGFGVTAKIDASNGNGFSGLKIIQWGTIPIKLSFTPPLPKSSENELTLNVSWELVV